MLGFLILMAFSGVDLVVCGVIMTIALGEKVGPLVGLITAIGVAVLTAHLGRSWIPDLLFNL